MNKKSLHPEWALACKRKGTELRLLKGKYYLYEVTSKWNPQKKRSVKITGKFLGRIEGWMFVNMIALKWYYVILNLLKKYELNKKYSPADFLLFLSAFGWD